MSLQQWCRDTAPPCPDRCRTKVQRNRPCAGLQSRHCAQHWGVTAHAVTQTERRVCSCCYFLWKKVTKELCGIGTHASIAAPRAVGFGAWGVCEGAKVCCTLHRNLTPSIEASLRTPPPIPRGADFSAAARVRVVEWSTTPQRRRSSGSSTDTRLSSSVDAGTFPLRVLRATSWTKTAGRESGATAYTGASRPMP